ncbi:Protein TRANSPARENT TESTA 9, partial [Bienertia sinuspersici]
MSAKNSDALYFGIGVCRAISGHLNKSTISLLVKIENDEVVSFPLYVEAIRFAFHEESMIRTAIRKLTLNVYHVGDESVDRFVTSGTLANYFTDLVGFFKRQCLTLNNLVIQASREISKDLSSAIVASVDEIEDNLYYYSDIISAGIPDVDRLITDNLLRLFILPLLLPSLVDAELAMGAVTSLYLLCCILRIVKIKDLANTIVSAFFCPQGAFVSLSKAKKVVMYIWQRMGGNLKLDSSEDFSLPNTSADLNWSLWEAVLSYLNVGNDVQILGSLSVLSTLLQTKVELEESMLDALGILPKRKQHKKLLL